MDFIDISNAPKQLVAATEAAILRYVLDGKPLGEAIVEAASDTYRTALARGCEEAQAERLGLFIAAVGAEMTADVRHR